MYIPDFIGKLGNGVEDVRDGLGRQDGLIEHEIRLTMND